MNTHTSLSPIHQILWSSNCLSNQEVSELQKIHSVANEALPKISDREFVTLVHSNKDFIQKLPASHRMKVICRLGRASLGCQHDEFKEMTSLQRLIQKIVQFFKGKGFSTEASWGCHFFDKQLLSTFQAFKPILVEDWKAAVAGKRDFPSLDNMRFIVSLDEFKALAKTEIFDVTQSIHIIDSFLKSIPKVYRSHFIDLFPKPLLDKYRDHFRVTLQQAVIEKDSKKIHSLIELMYALPPEDLEAFVLKSLEEIYPKIESDKTYLQFIDTFVTKTFNVRFRSSFKKWKRDKLDQQKLLIKNYWQAGLNGDNESFAKASSLLTSITEDEFFELIRKVMPKGISNLKTLHPFLLSLSEEHRNHYWNYKSKQ